MRINAVECAPLGVKDDWACESTTIEDATSTVLGMADLDVLEDVVTGKEPVDVLPDGSILHLINRKITGQVVEHLRLWPEILKSAFDNEPINGISLPEEGKVYLKGQVAVSFEPNDGLLEIVVWEATRELVGEQPA